MAIAGEFVIIRDISHPVACDARLTVVPESELLGSARVTISRSDLQLEIPRVAGVDEQLTLQSKFVLTAS